MWHVLLLFCLPVVLAQDPNAQFKLDGVTFFGSGSSSAGSTIEDDFGFGGKDIPLVFPKEESLQNGCTIFNTTLTGEFVVLFDRGECTFNQKVQTAQALGAISVLVGNQVSSVLNETTLELNDVCDVDCSISNADTQELCEANSKCNSGICLPAFVSSTSEELDFCCFLDKLRDMPVANSNNVGNDTDILPDILISAVFLGIEDTTFIKETLEESSLGFGNDEFDSVIVNIKERFRFEVDPSVIILILLGTGSVSIATFIAGKNDRQLVSILWGTKPNFLKEQLKEKDDADLRGGGAQGKVEEVESVELTPMQGLVMLICATVFLVGLFFVVRVYPQQVVIGIIIFFGLGAIYSTSYFFIRPIIRRVLPTHISLYLVKTPSISHYVFEESYTLESLIGFFITLVLVVMWFVFRHERDKVWLLQNLFSVAVALLFLSTLKLNTLKTGFYLLVGFCIYDIFMVFLTPFFGAGSVMLEVATAGRGGDDVVNFEINEDVAAQVCERTEDEQMPMLFLAPRFDYRGGFGLLGLGDVLIPGIFMTYIIRTDYYYDSVKIAKKMIEEQLKITEIGTEKFSFSVFVKSHYYFFSSVLAYLVALIVTFIANFQGWTINGVQGQPALLYIVPFVMVTFLLQLGSEKRKFLWEKSLDELMSNEEHDAEEGPQVGLSDKQEEKATKFSI